MRSAPSSSRSYSSNTYNYSGGPSVSIAPPIYGGGYGGYGYGGPSLFPPVFFGPSLGLGLPSGVFGFFALVFFLTIAFSFVRNSGSKRDELDD